MPYDIIIGRDDADKKRFKEKGLIYLGKGYVKMGNYTSLSNLIWMDIARSHVILIAGKRGCLTGETQIFTNRGYKPIKEFNEKKDRILSFNKEKKDFEWETAKLLKYPVKNEKILEIKFVNNKVIKLTKEHPLLLSTGRKLLSLLWTKADKLKKDDCILSIGKSINDLVPLKIKKIKEISGIKEVYDLSVDKNHSFIANGIISHNSGKSYTIGVMAEELADLPKEAKGNISTLIFDTMGIFWTMKFKNEKEKELLREWKLKPKNLPVKIFVPSGKVSEYEKNQIPVDKSFSLKASELEIEDWLLTFNLDLINPIAILIEKVIADLKEKGEYNIEEILDKIKDSKDEESKKIASALFEAATTWGIFAKKDEKGTEVSELIESGKTNILDLSCYSSVSTFNVRALVIGLISRKLFTKRMAARKKEEIASLQGRTEKKEMPLVWLFLDEAHEFLPQHEKTPATDSLIQLLREGRQPGISLVLATQQPGVIHRDVMTQSDIVISHRVTAKPDILALNNIMQTYLLSSINKYLDDLPDLKGSAIILDDNSERIYPLKIRPKFTWHGGEAPVAIKEEKEM